MVGDDNRLIGSTNIIVYSCVCVYVSWKFINLQMYAMIVIALSLKENACYKSSIEVP